MWISQLAEEAKLSTSTVRFYVREGLLQPRTGRAGGSRPYLEFSERDLRRAAVIRMGQAIGLSLTEIRLLADERRVGGRDRMLQTMTGQRAQLRKRAAEIAALSRFLDLKIHWLTHGCMGSPPEPPAIEVSGSCIPKARSRRRD